MSFADPFFALNAQAYDQHLNMVLGDVEETHTSIEVDEETLEESITVRFIIFLLNSGFSSHLLTLASPFEYSLLKERWKSCLLEETESNLSPLPCERNSKSTFNVQHVYDQITSSYPLIPIIHRGNHAVPGW